MIYRSYLGVVAFMLGLDFLKGRLRPQYLVPVFTAFAQFILMQDLFVTVVLGPPPVFNPLRQGGRSVAKHNRYRDLCWARILERNVRSIITGMRYFSPLVGCIQ